MPLVIMYFLIAVFLWIFYCCVNPVSLVREDLCFAKADAGKRGAGARVAQEKKCEESLPKRTFPLKYVLRIVSLCLNYVRCKRRYNT